MHCSQHHSDSASCKLWKQIVMFCMYSRPIKLNWDALTANGDWQPCGRWFDLLVKVAWPLVGRNFQCIVPLGTCLPCQNGEECDDPNLHVQSRALSGSNWRDSPRNTTTTTVVKTPLIAICLSPRSSLILA